MKKIKEEKQRSPEGSNTTDLCMLRLNPKSTDLLNQEQTQGCCSVSLQKYAISATDALILCFIVLPAVKCQFFLLTAKCSCLKYLIRVYIK